MKSMYNRLFDEFDTDEYHVEMETIDQGENEPSLKGQETYTFYIIENETGDWINAYSVDDLSEKSLDKAIEYFKRGMRK